MGPLLFWNTFCIVTTPNEFLFNGVLYLYLLFITEVLALTDSKVPTGSEKSSLVTKPELSNDPFFCLIVDLDLSLVLSFLPNVGNLFLLFFATFLSKSIYPYSS